MSKVTKKMKLCANTKSGYEWLRLSWRKQTRDWKKRFGPKDKYNAVSRVGR